MHKQQPLHGFNLHSELHILKSRVCMHIWSSVHAHTVECACTYGRVYMHIRSSVHAHTVECACTLESKIFKSSVRAHKSNIKGRVCAHE